MSAASLAADGHTVIGVDVNAGQGRGGERRTQSDRRARLDELLASGVASGRLRATTDAAEAVQASEASLLCVGTPSRRNGSLDLTYLERVRGEIGRTLRHDCRTTTSSSCAARCCRARRTR